MHATLKPKTNVILLVLWGALAVLLAASLSPVPWFLFGLSALLGGAAGLVQARSLRSAGAEFVAANSLMGVRKALSSSPWGKRYIILFWCSQALLLVLFGLEVFGRYTVVVSGSLFRVCFCSRARVFASNVRVKEYKLKTYMHNTSLETDAVRQRIFSVARAAQFCVMFPDPQTHRRC